MNRSVALLVAMGFLSVACKDKKPESSEPAPQASAAPGPVASVAAPAASATVAASGKMAHCPSTVTGAKTDIADSPNGVEVSVTSKDDAAVQEIRARSAFLASSAKNDVQAVAHNGSGEGGGIFGRCPIVMRNTTLAVTDVPGGSKLVVTPRDAKERDWLRHEARARNDELAMPGSEGAGINKMAHCPNAVKGALTSVADQKDAVTITVTAKDDASVKEIHDRSQKIALAAKVAPAARPMHDGTGNGGGGLGRCPIVLKDTEIAVKETPTGSVITVKPKKAGDLKALDKEIRDRSAKFAAL